MCTGKGQLSNFELYYLPPFTLSNLSCPNFLLCPIFILLIFTVRSSLCPNFLPSVLSYLYCVQSLFFDWYSRPSLFCSKCLIFYSLPSVPCLIFTLSDLYCVLPLFCPILTLSHLYSVQFLSIVLLSSLLHCLIFTVQTSLSDLIACICPGNSVFFS